MARRGKRDVWYPADWDSLAKDRLMSGKTTADEWYDIFEALRFWRSKRGSVGLFTDNVDREFRRRYGIHIVCDWPIDDGDFKVEMVREENYEEFCIKREQARKKRHNESTAKEAT